MAASLFHIFLLVCFSIFVSANPTQETSQKQILSFQNVFGQSRAIHGRIVNGTKAILGQFPHLISLRRSWSASHFCGGSVIAQSWVLTAAHCMFMNNEEVLPWSIVVIGGEIKLNQATKTGQRSGVQHIYVHPEYDPRTLHNDVALLELKVPFKFTSELQPAAFPTMPVKPTTICQVSGWGYPQEDMRILSNDLMFVDLPIVDVKTCRKLLANVSYVPRGMLCAGYLEGLRDACQGDSGGGMVCQGVLTGIVSGGEGCANPRLPGLYADIVYYREWIANVIGSTVLRTGNSRCGSSATNIKPTILAIAICSLTLLGLIRL